MAPSLLLPISCLALFYISRNLFTCLLMLDPALLNPGLAEQAAFFKDRQLSARESEIAALIIGGWSSRQMAEALSISENTVNYHIKNALRKCEKTNRKALMTQFLEPGGHRASSGRKNF